MSGHIDLGHIHTSNANSIHDALTQGASSAASIMAKLQDSLQSRATITSRNNDCTEYKIRFGDEDFEYKAVLAFDKALYSWIGLPKMGDTVVVVHNAGHSAHILFTANDKNIFDPPMYGSTTKFQKSIASSKCMG